MRNLFVISIVLVILFVLGCSGTSKEPVMPNTNSDQSSLPLQSNSSYEILMSGTMNLDSGTISYDDRIVSGYLNVTSLIGSNFTYQINGWYSPGVLDITLNMNNPTTITVNDVCIVFENLYGKTVTNADSIMDIYGPYDLDPFIAFRKQDPTRAFPPGPDSQQLLLSINGSSPAINYFIIAHIGGNTGGVYEIREFIQDQPLPPTGSCNISVTTLDWQDDVSYVTADTRFISGTTTSLIKSAQPNVWTGTVNNTLSIPAGTYPLTIVGQSPSVPEYRTYQIFPFVVSSGYACMPVNPTIVVNRVHTGVYDSHRIDTDFPFTISWEAPAGCTPESYVIHVDRDPSDGYANNFMFLAEVPSTQISWTGDAAEFTAVQRYVPGWTYVVTARAKMGDPTSDGPYSDQVHVITSGFETCPGWDLPGGKHTTLNNIDTEGWVATQETAYDTLQPILTVNSWTGDCLTNPCAVEGCGYVFLDIGLNNTAGHWMGMTHITPVPSTMPNITVRQLDFATHSDGYYNYNTTGGIVVGTCPYQPGELWTTPVDFNWATADSTLPYEPYQDLNMQFVDDTFDVAPYGDVPAIGPNSWYFFSTAPFDWGDKKFRGSNVNIDGDINDPYVGIMACISGNNGSNQETRIDEVSIAIY